MKMDISHLTLDELYDLNKHVCARIDELKEKQDNAALAILRPGMTVQFKNKQETITGTQGKSILIRPYKQFCPEVIF